MKKFDNFTNCLAILANADFKMAETNDIYRLHAKFCSLPINSDLSMILKYGCSC